MKKTLLFDFAGVIGTESYFGWLKKNIPDYAERKDSFKKVADKSDLGSVDEETFFKNINQVTGIPVPNIWAEIYEPVTINQDLIGLILKLKPNYEIVLFSNYLASLLRKILIKHNLVNLFDHIFISSEHKLKKPDELAFMKVLEISGVQKNEVIFIDDRIENIEAGKALGIESIRFVSVEQLKKDLVKAGIKLRDEE